VWSCSSITGTQNEFWKEVSKEEDPVESQGIGREKSCGRMPPNCQIPKISLQQQTIGVTAASNNVSAWSRNGPKRHKRRRRRSRRKNNKKR
jgi:hypothetical protein